MKDVLFTFIFTLLWPNGVFCQKNKSLYDEYGVVYMPVNDSTITYNTKKGKRYEIKLNQISFVDGENALVNYLKKQYYKPRLYDDDYAYRVFFFILFDSKLKIKEVRCCVLPFSQYTETQKRRIKLYTKGLKKTKNKWKKTSTQKKYIYAFSFVTD